MNTEQTVAVGRRRKVRPIDEATTSNSELDGDSDLEVSTSESEVNSGSYEQLQSESDAKGMAATWRRGSVVYNSDIAVKNFHKTEDSSGSQSSDSQQTKIEKMPISLSDEQMFDFQLQVPVDGKKSRSASFTLVENKLYYKNPNQIDPFMLRQQRRGSAHVTSTSRQNSLDANFENDLRVATGKKLFYLSTRVSDDWSSLEMARKTSAPVIFNAYDLNRRFSDHMEPANAGNEPRTANENYFIPVPRSFEVAPIEPTKPAVVEVDDWRCEMCKNVYTDPRVLDCLHTFCLQCLVELDDGKNSSLAYWRKSSESSDAEWHGSHNTSLNDSMIDIGASLHSMTASPEPLSPFRHRRSIAKHKEKLGKSTSKDRNPSVALNADKYKSLVCPKCNHATDIPVGGIYRLPINFVMMRKVELVVAKATSDAINTIWCNLCSTKSPSTHFCLNCRLNLCNFCRDAHKRQKLTQNHQVKSLVDIKQTTTDGDAKKNLLHYHQCQIHPNYELKLYCTSCHQVICNDCTVVLHRGHKFISTAKASKTYMKMVKESLDKSKPMCTYTIHSVSKLNDIAKKINQKCETVQGEVDMFLCEYFEALDVHRRTLLSQISRARENKMESICAQKMDLERRSSDIKAVITFTEELLQGGSDVEALTFVSILLKRFQFCQQSQTSLDVKITDSLQFLPEVKAPSNKAQNNIPLYGIITTQIASAKHCYLEINDGLMNLRVHRKAELVLVSKDKEDRQMCHGGLVLAVDLKYKDGVSRTIPTQVSDKRDGTYIITFVPDVAGMLRLHITINEKPIKDSPFLLRARKLRPHTGRYHCCTFCSTNGSKTVTCACNSVMPGGYKGCGHGHDGHPGQRHWSCCANVMENSECSTANAVALQTADDK